MSDKYKNEKGMYIDVNTDKKGKDHISFYDKDPQEEGHKSIHINWDSSTGKGNIIDNTSGEKEVTYIDTNKCFLTTACMRYYKNNFDDNCYELTTLRWFRDNFVSGEDIKHYYTLAPIIVEEINKLDSRDIIYKNIYENVIVTCINYIQNLDYKRTYDVYKMCILELEEKYVRPVLGRRLINVLKKKRDLMYTKEVCCNGDQVVKSFSEENTQKSEHVYRLVPSSSNGIEVKVSDKNIENNSRFVATLFD